MLPEGSDGLLEVGVSGFWAEAASRQILKGALGPYERLALASTTSLGCCQACGSSTRPGGPGPLVRASVERAATLSAELPE